MLEISTSILSVNENAVTKFYDLEVAGTNYFHIDVMDGKFVENNTEDIMLEYITTLSHITNVGMDVHLMCENVEKYIEDYIDFYPDTITFHIEAIKDNEHAMAIIKKIKENGIKVGIAVNPDTEVEKVYDYLPYIHKVLVMTVVPGKGGQKLIESCLDKIKTLKKYLEEQNLDTIIEADGGINDTNIEKIVDAGVEIAVAGNYIISAENMKEAIDKLKI